MPSPWELNTKRNNHVKTDNGGEKREEGHERV